MSTIKNLESLSSKELVELFNKYADKPVKKFADRATALKRVAAVLPVKNEPKAKKVVGAVGDAAVAKKEANRARKITILVEGNPKKGTAAVRFDLYKNGMTVGKYIELGGQLRDCAWDSKVGFISVK